jgi:hypothetical protein
MKKTRKRASKKQAAMKATHS